MSSFIGTKPHQVPTNGDLGRLAFVDYIGLSDFGSSIPTIASATSISPTSEVTYVSGVAAISTIVPPFQFSNGGVVTLIPTGKFTITTSDNVAIAVSAEISKPIRLVYNAVVNKWYPSYSNTVNRVTITAPPNGSTLTIADGKTLTVNKNLTLTSVDPNDNKTLTVNKSITLDGVDDKTLTLNASVTMNTTSSNAVTLNLRTGGTVVYTTDSVGKLTGGNTNQIAYQTATDTTGFISAPSAANSVLAYGSSLGWTGGATNNGLLIYNGSSITWTPAPTTANTVLTYNGSSVVWAGSGLTPTPIKTSASPAYTAAANDLVRCDTTTAAFSVSLPASPLDGTIIGFSDVSNTFGTKPLTILANGKTIEGDSTAMVLDVTGAYLEFLYVNTTGNWKMLQIPTLSGGLQIATTNTLGVVRVDGTTITVNSSGVISTGSNSVAGLNPTDIKINSYTTSTGELVRCNTTSTAFSVSLPASPTDGSKVGILDVTNSFGTKNLTVLPLGGKTIESDTSLVLDISGTYVEFMYVSSTSNWKLLETPIGTNSSMYSTNITNGSANQIVYQSATNTTSFITAPSASNTALIWNGSSYVWSSLDVMTTSSSITAFNMGII